MARGIAIFQLMKLLKISRILVILSVFNLTGCISLSNLQSAETLPPGEFESGIGSIVAPNLIIPEISARYGISENWDAGLKFTPPQLLSLDLKHRFFQDKISLSADLTVSYFQYDEVTVWGYYPSIIVGRQHWYTGFKFYFGDAGKDKKPDRNNYFKVDDMDYEAFSVFFGGIIGTDSFRLLLN